MKHIEKSIWFIQDIHKSKEGDTLIHTRIIHPVGTKENPNKFPIWEKTSVVTKEEDEALVISKINYMKENDALGVFGSFYRDNVELENL